MEHIGEIVAEMETAMRWMVGAQVCKVDWGWHKIDDILRTARVPRNIFMTRESDEHFGLLIQAGSHAPIGYRLEMPHALWLQAEISRVMKIGLN